MGRLVHRWLAVLAAMLLGLLGAASNPQPAFACACTPMTTGRAARQADAIFRGTVTTVRDVERGDERRRDIRFAVDGVFKGNVYADQVVATSRDAAGCGLTPEVGTTWVIFSVQSVEGRGDDAVTRLATDTCRGNLSTANPPRLLGQPRAPIPGPSDREERATGTDRALTRGLAVGGVVLLALGAVSVAALAVLWRPGRSR